MISREELAAEIRLREQVAKAIKIVKHRITKKNVNALIEELNFRNIIQNLILEAATEDPEKDPHPATGINVLEDLLKKIIPILEDDFKVLTTSAEQRESFRSHIIHGVRNVLAPVKSNEKAGQTSASEDPVPETGLAEAVEVNIEDEDEEGKFIDIEGDKPAPEEEPPDPREEFGIEGSDETGRNAAYNSFKKIENQIVDAYALLGDEQDQSVFYDYLVTNLKLYFDKFETELQTTLEEPTTPEYEEEKGELEASAAEAGLPDEEPPPEELGL